MSFREDQLKKHLVNNPPSDFPFLVAVEWHVVSGRSHEGVGDLVFANESQFLVVEVKALNPNSGNTARVSRSRARQEVKEQVTKYARAWAKLHPGTEVFGQSYVNGEWGVRQRFIEPKHVPFFETGQTAQRQVLTDDNTGGWSLGSKLVGGGLLLGIAALGLSTLSTGNNTDRRRHRGVEDGQGN